MECERAKHWHEVVGYNYRMTNMQAAIGLAQMERIDIIQNKRYEIGALYKESFASLYDNFLLPMPEIASRKSVIWLVSFLLMNKNREKLISEARKKNIDIRPFFYPLSDMPIYKQFARRTTKISSEISRSGISLPTSLNISDDNYKIIISNIKELFNSKWI